MITRFYSKIKTFLKQHSNHGYQGYQGRNSFIQHLVVFAEEDLAFGFKVAKEVSRLEIGQTVVVKDGTVLALEGFEGTDQCLQRGGELAGSKGGATAVKVAKANHDLRFDLPCIGDRTVETCARAGISALGFEAGRTILLEQAEVEKLCKKHNVALAALA